MPSDQPKEMGYLPVGGSNLEHRNGLILNRGQSRPPAAAKLQRSVALGSSDQWQSRAAGRASFRKALVDESRCGVVAASARFGDIWSSSCNDRHLTRVGFAVHRQRKVWAISRSGGGLFQAFDRRLRVGNQIEEPARRTNSRMPARIRGRLSAMIRANSDVNSVLIDSAPASITFRRNISRNGRRLFGRVVTIRNLKAAI